MLLRLAEVFGKSPSRAPPEAESALSFLFPFPDPFPDPSSGELDELELELLLLDELEPPIEELVSPG